MFSFRGLHNSLDVTICADAQDAVSNGFDYASTPGEFSPLHVSKVVVVRNGTVEGNPTVDFVLEDQNGKKYVFAVTGKLLKSIPC